LLSFAVASPASAANPGGSTLVQKLASCARIDTSDARLACYDALARANATPVPTASSVTQAPAIASAPAAAAVAPVSASPGPASDELSNFGLSPAQIHPVASGPTAIEAHVAAIFANRGDYGQTYLKLDNGETWSTSDDTTRLAVGDDIHIKRAALGSFLLTTPANLSYRVRRVH
jgi:hypothetical protein